MGKTKDTHVVEINGGGNLEAVVEKLIKRLEALDRLASKVGNRDPLSQLVKSEGSAGYGAALAAEAGAFEHRVGVQTTARGVRNQQDFERQTWENALNPGTTEETRKDAATQRRGANAAASTARAHAAVIRTQASIDKTNLQTLPLMAAQDKRFRERYPGMTQPEAWQVQRVHAESRQAQKQAAEDYQAAIYGGLGPLDRARARRQERVADSAARVQAVRDMTDADGMTPKEKREHGLKMKQLNLETLKQRKEINAERKKEMEQAKQERTNSSQLHGLLGMVPGGRVLSMAERMIPGAAGMMKGAAAYGGRHIVGPSVGYGGLDMGSLALRGTAGLSAEAAGGSLLGLAGVAGLASILTATGIGAGLGGVIAGEYGVSDARERFAPSVGRIRNLASTLRLGAGAGGVGGVESFLSTQEVSALADRGIGTAQMASSYAAFVSGRGSADNGAGAQARARQGMQEALLWGVDGNTLGQLAAGGAYGMSAKLAGAGIRGGALSASQNALLGVVSGAQSHGLSYNSDAYAEYARQMSSSVGGGQYGGILAAQRMAGAGTGLANNMRSSMSSMADMAVLAEAAAGGGDYMDVIERMETMTPAEKAAAMSRQLGGDGSRYAKFSLGESKLRSGARPGSDPGAAEPGSFNDALGALQEGANLSNDRLAARSGSMAERIVQMDTTTQAQLAQIVENLGLLNTYLETRKATLASVQRGHPTNWSIFSPSDWMK